MHNFFASNVDRLPDGDRTKMTLIRAESLELDFPVFDTSDFSLKRTALSLVGVKQIRKKHFSAIRGIDLEIAQHERVGLYGENGSGKSTLLRLLADIYQPTGGKLSIEGDVTAILGMGAGTNPEMSADANIRMLLRAEGIKPQAEMIDSIWDFTEIEDEFRYMPLKAFSSGMQMRVLFSVSTFGRADILLLDEWMSVMDKNFQDKAEQRMLDLTHTSNILVLASHNFALLERVCTRILFLSHGRIVEERILESNWGDGRKRMVADR